MSVLDFHDHGHVDVHVDVRADVCVNVFVHVCVHVCVHVRVQGLPTTHSTDTIVDTLLNQRYSVLVPWSAPENMN
jgi:hypothetical protein